MFQYVIGSVASDNGPKIFQLLLNMIIGEEFGDKISDFLVNILIISTGLLDHMELLGELSSYYKMRNFLREM
jgi:hypothetical protein